MVSASLFLTEADVPDDFPYKKTTNWKWAMGGSAIATPFGTYAAEPLFGKEGLVIADLDLADRIVAKNVFDCMGHYSRWDVTQLRLKREAVGPEPGRDAFPAVRASRVVEVPAPPMRPGPGDAEEREKAGAPPRAIMGALPESLAKPLLAALSEKFGPGAGTISAARAELDSDDLDELARSHGLSQDEVVSFIHDFIDLIRRRSEFVVPDLVVEEPADA